MSVVGSEVQFCELVDFSSPIDFSPAWQAGAADAADDIGTVIHDVKQEVEVEADGCYDGLPPWARPLASDTAAALVMYPSMAMPLKNQTRTFTDILREVKVPEDTLHCAVARLGGGTQGLQVLLEHVNHWASDSQDEDVPATIKREILGLGMTPVPMQHCNPGLSISSKDGSCGDPCVDASSLAMSHVGNHGAAYTRALRKSQMLRQRGLTKVRHPSINKNGSQSQQWRQSARHQWSQDMELNLSNENGKGYEFLFQKELRASDVSSLGRIVLPKKDAERYLPCLVAREGIMLALEDYHCGKFWTARYRFWPNNKSRMYLLENIGDFVNFHCLQERDLLLCYRNDRGGYVIRGQKVPSGGKSSARGLINRGAQARGTAPTSDMESATASTPAARQFGEGESTCGTHNDDVTHESLDSSNCTLGRVGDAGCDQDGVSCDAGFSEQAGYRTCCGEVLGHAFPASDKPLLQDWDLDPAVAMLSVGNVKQLPTDENYFLI